MIKNKNIICISSIDWDFIWQGHQEIMSSFAANGNRVLFIENTGVRAPQMKDVARLTKRIRSWFKSVRGFRQEREGIYIYSPVILPFPYSRLARMINRRLLVKALKRWLKIMEFHDPIIWTFLPTGTALDIIDNIDHELLVYYCIADFYQLGNPKKVRKTENELIKKSDLIFVQGEFLKDRCRQFNKNVHIFPFGVNTEAFSEKPHNYTVPEDMKNITHPIIGYVGGLHRHVDFDLIRHIAQVHPQWSIVMVGPVQADIERISGLKNVFLIGKKEFLLLPQYVQTFDVGIIPYEVNDYTRTVFPTKLNEYHAMGKPVVSTALPEVVSFNKANGALVSIASTNAEFMDQLSRALSDNDSATCQKRIESAMQNTWSARIEKMSELIEKAIADKSNRTVNWPQNFIRFYRISRSKALKMLGLAFIAYLLIFYTPLIWIVARPLKISQPLEKADCIVVFAGGVGESGKAGQGYEERVQYVVSLYKQGYAKNIIFSSGYIYAIKEAEIMKALAVSLGVSPDAIILEKKAANTYQNVKYSSSILRDRHMTKAIVVSSPYNMRRIALVSKKISPDIRFIYEPLPYSLFFGDGKRVELKHISAILHEYIAIVFYYFKGYV